MCNFLHIATRPLSSAHSSGRGDSFVLISHEIAPVFAWLTVLSPEPKPVLCGTPHQRWKYTTSRECKHRSGTSIQTFGDLARFDGATADLHHCRNDRSPGWNGGNLPVHVEGQMKVFADDVLAKTQTRSPCEAWRQSFEAQQSRRLVNNHVCRSSVSCIDWMRQRRLDRRRSHTNSNPNARRPHTHAYANSYANANTDANAGIALGFIDVVSQFVYRGRQLQRLPRTERFGSVLESRQRRYNEFYRFNRASGTDLLLRSDRGQQFQR